MKAAGDLALPQQKRRAIDFGCGVGRPAPEPGSCLESAHSQYLPLHLVLNGSARGHFLPRAHVCFANEYAIPRAPIGKLSVMS